MKIKVILILIVLLVITSIAVVYITLTNYSNTEKNCLDANNLADIDYKVCYDLETNSIYLTIDRKDNYEISSINLSFKDTETKTITVNQIPEPGQKRKYKINVSTNPTSISVSLNMPGIIICQKQKIITPLFCDISAKQNISVNISTNNQYQTNRTPIEKQDSIIVALLSEDLVNKSTIWQPKCTSQWECNQWEICTNNIQKRECIDKNNCEIPTNFPGFAKNCGNTCNEGWVCEWSSCSSGESTPACYDSNNCGTSFLKPDKISCITSKSCTPDIRCSNWSDCKTSYGFNDLIYGVQKLEGIRTSVCIDNNNCAPSQYITKQCSILVDTYIKEVKINEESYIEIYEKNTNNLLTTIKDSRKEKIPSLDITF